MGPPESIQRRVETTRTCAQLQRSSARSSALSSGAKVQLANFILKSSRSLQKKLQENESSWCECRLDAVCFCIELCGSCHAVVADFCDKQSMKNFLVIQQGCT